MARYDLAGNLLPDLKPTQPAEETHIAVAPSSMAPASQTRMLTHGIASETPWQRVYAYSGLLITLVALTLLTYAVAAIPPPHAIAPVSYDTASFADNSFSLQAPTGWKEKQAFASLSLSNGSAEIKISPVEIGPDDNTADLVSLHQEAQMDVANHFENMGYSEAPARYFGTGMGTGVISEWTAAPSLDKLHGYRATLLSGSSSLEAICFCNARDWRTLQPAFLHVLQSIQATPENQ